MPSDTCGTTRNCVWRAASRLTGAGRRTRPWDLCIAITASGEPCGRSAAQLLGVNRYAMDHGFDDEPEIGQPFCEWHAALITKDLLASAVENNHEAVLDRAAEKRKQTRDAVVNERGVVYFARRGKEVKIGVTVNPASRLRTLELASGFTFDEVVTAKGDRNLEAKYHRMFDEYRGVGEWFRMAPAIRAVMDTLSPL